MSAANGFGSSSITARPLKWGGAHRRSEADLSRFPSSLDIEGSYLELFTATSKNEFFLVINSQRLFNIFIFGQKFWPDLLFFVVLRYSTTGEKQYIHIHIWRPDGYYMKNHHFRPKIMIFHIVSLKSPNVYIHILFFCSCTIS